MLVKIASKIETAKGKNVLLCSLFTHILSLRDSFTYDLLCLPISDCLWASYSGSIIVQTDT